MAKYIIVENSYEYNDEYYDRPSCGGYKITSKLYTEENLAEAHAEVKRLNERSQSQKWYRDCDDEPIQPFQILKIEE
jgi:hypothetical protein